MKRGVLLLLLSLFLGAIAHINDCQSRVHGDPSFAGFLGQKFIFRGTPGSFYHLFSDPWQSLNAEFAAVHSSLEKGTIMKAFGLIIHGHNIKYNIVGDKAELSINDVLTDLDQPITLHSSDVECVSIVANHDKVMIETPTMNYAFLLKRPNSEIGNYLDVALSRLIEDAPFLGGLLGQTASPSFTKKEDLFNSSSLFSTDAVSNKYKGRIDCSVFNPNNKRRMSFIRTAYESYDFENPVLSSPYYLYNPGDSNSPTMGNGWNYVAGAGISVNRDGAFAVAGDTNGYQYSFLQWAHNSPNSFSSMSKTLSNPIPAQTTAVIVWSDAGRKNVGTGALGYRLFITAPGGEVYQSKEYIVPVNKKFQSRAFTIFNAGDTDATFTLQFQITSSSSTTEMTVLIDDVVISPYTDINNQNPNFNEPDLAGNNLKYSNAISGWDISSGGVAVSSGSGFEVKDPHENGMNPFLFLQGIYAVGTGRVSLDPTKDYTLSWINAVRSNNQLSYTVTVSTETNTPVVTKTFNLANSQPWDEHKIAFRSTCLGTYLVKFNVTTANGDQTLFIDKVFVSPPTTTSNRTGLSLSGYKNSLDLKPSNPYTYLHGLYNGIWFPGGSGIGSSISGCNICFKTKETSDTPFIFLQANPVGSELLRIHVSLVAGETYTFTFYYAGRSNQDGRTSFTVNAYQDGSSTSLANIAGTSVTDSDYTKSSSLIWTATDTCNYDIVFFVTGVTSDSTVVIRNLVLSSSADIAAP